MTERSFKLHGQRVTAARFVPLKQRIKDLLNTKPDDELLTTAQLASALGVHVSNLWPIGRTEMPANCFRRHKLPSLWGNHRAIKKLRRAIENI